MKVLHFDQITNKDIWRVEFTVTKFIFWTSHLVAYIEPQRKPGGTGQASSPSDIVCAGISTKQATELHSLLYEHKLETEWTRSVLDGPTSDR